MKILRSIFVGGALLLVVPSFASAGCIWQPGFDAYGNSNYTNACATLAGATINLTCSVAGSAALPQWGTVICSVGGITLFNRYVSLPSTQTGTGSIPAQSTPGTQTISFSSSVGGAVASGSLTVDVAATSGAWSAAPSCPTVCGTAASTQYGTCSGGTCSGTAPSRTCNATAACPTGTWTATACLTSCGASYPKTYTCTGGNLVCSGAAPATTCTRTACPTGTIFTSSNVPSSWTITGPATITGSGVGQLPVSAPVGTYTITWGAVSGYTTPASQSQSLVSFGVINFSGEYLVVPTGTWSYPVSCSAVCGSAQVTQTQTCSGGNGLCTGSATSRTCNATSACVAPPVTTVLFDGSSSGTTLATPTSAFTLQATGTNSPTNCWYIRYINNAWDAAWTSYTCSLWTSATPVYASTFGFPTSAISYLEFSMANAAGYSYTPVMSVTVPSATPVPVVSVLLNGSASNLTLATPISSFTLQVTGTNSPTACYYAVNPASTGVYDLWNTYNCSDYISVKTKVPSDFGFTTGTNYIQFIMLNAGGYSNPIERAVTVPAPTNGACGTSNGQTLPSQPFTGLCSTGAATTVLGGVAGPWLWNCNGSNGGTNASCSAFTNVIVGSVGSANGTPSAVAPTTNLCAYSSTPPTVTGSGPWTWVCFGSNGGANVVGNAPLSTICGNGTCDTGETLMTCPTDCHATVQQF